MQLLSDIHKRTSIKTKGLFYVMVLITVIFLTVSVVVISTARRNLIVQLNQFHMSIAKKLSLTASDALISTDYAFLMEQIRRLKASGEIRSVKIIDQRGVIVSSYNVLEIGEYDKELSVLIDRNFDEPVSDPGTGADISMPIKIEGDVLGALEVSFDWNAERKRMDQEFRETKRQLTYLAVIIFALGTGGAFIVSRTLTRPIIELLQEIEKFDKEIYPNEGSLISPGCKDETVQLRDAFYRMIENLRKYLKEFMKMSEERERLTCMATIGQMSAQIAHETRNSLYAIKGAVSGLERADDMSEVRDYVDIIKEEILGMTMMSDDFLRFARMPEPAPVPCNVDDVVQKVIELLEPDLEDSNIKIVKRSGSALPKIMADPTLLKQAFMNLFINAIQAMEQGGMITIAYRLSGDLMEVSIQDTGPGVPEEIRHKVFQPFFSTKIDGTGLGLAAIYKIIVAQHGEIALEDSDTGAHFTMKLPLADIRGR